MYEWFQFADMDQAPYNPILDSMITIERFWQKKSGSFEETNWRSEEWLIRSALVPVEQLHDAALHIQSAHRLKFFLGWEKDSFNFGESSRYADIQLYPIAIFQNHPISKESSITLSHQFISYHALEKRGQTQYFHPLDNLVAAEAIIETHDVYDNSGWVVIHTDYLRDFLATVNMGLLISIVADRFANAPTRAALEIEPDKRDQIDEYTTISTSLHTPRLAKHQHFRGRSILNRNIIVEPYNRPKYHRSPWPFYGEDLYQDDEYPTFIINIEGDKNNCLGILFFRII